MSTTGIDTPTFSGLWLEIGAVLVALGFDQAEIDRLKAEHCGEEDYLDVLCDWANSEEDIKSELKNIGQTQTRTQQTIEKNKTKLEQVLQVVNEIRQSQLNTDQEDEILKKLAKVDVQNTVKYYTDRYLEGTRESIFGKVNNWLNDRNSPNRVMVISGNPGMGKSVIAAMMCKRMQEDSRLSGSHFCQHDKARHRNPKVMLQSLAYHLSYSLPEYKKALVEQLSRNLGLEINDMEVGDLFELLFEVPLSSLKDDPGSTSLVVIDALDESEYQGRNKLLEVIAKYFDKLPVWIRFLVTTRPDINICESLKSLEPLLLEPNDEENLEDIPLCFEQQLSDLLKPENRELILKELVQKSEGSILCAKFLVDFIKKNFSILTLEQLDSTLPSGISSVYQSYFKRLQSGLCKELKVNEDQFFNFLSAITAAREPLPLGFVSKLLFSGTLSSAVQRKVNKAIACISSLLPVQDDCIHFFHKSVKDWLASRSCYRQHDFSVDESEGHHILSRLCVDEFDAIKRKGVNSSQQFSDTAAYALQHGVRHMLESDESTRALKYKSLVQEQEQEQVQELVNKYVLDVELVYAKLCVDNTAASEDILCVKKFRKQEGLRSFCLERQNVLGTLLFLLRKHRKALKDLPHTIFQTLLNEGGPELSSEASNLLGTKYSDIPYMEYLNKNDLQGGVQTHFYCSSQVACFDVSPQSDYMACECCDGTIQLWSLHTGKLMWKRPVMTMKLYSPYCHAYKTSEPSAFLTYFSFYRSSQLSECALSCFRSVVFHPTKEVVLPGVLSHAYTFQGDQIRLFPESNCSFSVCSVSGDTIITDCPDDAKCLIMWSLKDGTEITRVTRNDDVLSFGRSRDGKLLAISHCTGCICLVDVMSGFRTLAETVTPKVCGMLKFAPDNRLLFCWHLPLRGPYKHCFCLNVNMEINDKFSLDVSSDSVFYKPWEFESRSEGGFLLGDPFYVSCGMSIGTLAFIINEQSVLRSSSSCDFIQMESIDELTKGSEVRKTIVSNLVFSVSDETVYVVEGTRLKAWDVPNGELKAEKTTGSEIRCDCCPVAVKGGILLTTRSGTLELWNCELSKCVRCWADVKGISRLIPITDERVLCTGTGGKIITVVDTGSGDKEETVKHFYGTFVSCNSKCRVIYTVDGIFRLIPQPKLWAKPWPRVNAHSSLAGMFSPTEQFFVISGVLPGRPQGVYVLDAASGNTLHVLCANERVYDCKFVGDEECVIFTYDAASDSRLQLFNVRSAELLSVLNVYTAGASSPLASCPGKGLIALGLKHSKLKFKVIQVKMPAENESCRKSKRSALE